MNSEILKKVVCYVRFRHAQKGSRDAAVASGKEPWGHRAEMTTQSLEAPEGEYPKATPPAGLTETRVTAMALAVVLSLQLTLVFTRSVNWDEFWFYHLVVQFNAGDLSMPLQTLHARLFAWLPALGGRGIDNIVFARLIMFACELVTLFAIVAIARRFVDLPTALIASLLYVTAGFVFQHGTSFRTDPMATSAMMGSLAIMARRPNNIVTMLSMASLIAVAVLITTKVILYLPAFIGLAWLDFQASRQRLSYFLRICVLVALTGALFSLLYYWHTQDLAVAKKVSQSSVGGNGAALPMLAGAARWIFFLGVPPYITMIYKAMLTAPLLTILAWAAPFAIVSAPRPVPEKIALFGFWSIICVPLFYKNTAAYFYVFMFAPLVVGCLEAIALLQRRYGAHLLSVILLGITVGLFAVEDRQVIKQQRLVQDTASELFEEPIAYFDHNGMLPEFDKKNYLMTPSGMTTYHEAGVPTYRDAMQKEPVPLLLSNWSSLDLILLTDDDSLLLPDDLVAVRQNYIPYHGPFWLAGRQIEAGSSYSDELLVPGDYTVMGGPATVDGQRYKAGDTIALDRGMHNWSAPEGDSRLVWGANRQPPANPWPEGALYVGF